MGKMMMHMTFYWGKKVIILFDFWKTDSWLSYSLTLFACFVFSVFYQYMEDRRQRFKLLYFKSSPPAAAEAPLLYPTKLLSSGGRRWSPAKFAGAVLFGVNSAIGYLLMLAVMSFNGGVLVAVVVGLAFGYLLFRSSSDAEVFVVDNPCACA